MTFTASLFPVPTQLKLMISIVTQSLEIMFSYEQDTRKALLPDKKEIAKSIEIEHQIDHTK